MSTDDAEMPSHTSNTAVDIGQLATIIGTMTINNRAIPDLNSTTTDHSAAGTRATTAVSVVMRTQELLEMILMRVMNPKTLLLSQRVCKKFRDTIQGNKDIREYIFDSEVARDQLLWDNYGHKWIKLIDETDKRWLRAAFQIISLSHWDENAGIMNVLLDYQTSRSMDDILAHKGSWRQICLPSGCQLKEVHFRVGSNERGSYYTDNMGLGEGGTVGKLVDKVVAWKQAKEATGKAARKAY